MGRCHRAHVAGPPAAGELADAARGWAKPWRRMRVRPCRPGSREAVLHDAEAVDTLTVFPPDPAPALLESHGHRAIGVVYRAAFARSGNCLPNVPPRRYDAILYLDTTHSLRPLHVVAHEEGDVPKNYPSRV